MEISIKKEDLATKSLFVATPMYGGMNHGLYMKACLDLQGLCMQYGIAVKFSFLFNESLITRARNYLVDEFIHRSDCTHLLFLDSDIHFDPRGVIALLAIDKDVIGGLYPKKALPVNYVINLQPQTKIQGDIFTVDTAGTGFMLFKRNVYEKLIAAHPDCKYVDDVGLGKQYEPMMYSIFDCKIDAKGHYLSEDWLFCRRWQDMGGEIWVHSKVLLNHIGHYEFQGDLSKIDVIDKAKNQFHGQDQGLPAGAPAALADAIGMAKAGQPAAGPQAA